jgi:hypothetical protein
MLMSAIQETQIRRSISSKRIKRELNIHHSPRRILMSNTGSTDTIPRSSPKVAHHLRHQTNRARDSIKSPCRGYRTETRQHTSEASPAGVRHALADNQRLSRKSPDKNKPFEDTDEPYMQKPRNKTKKDRYEGNVSRQESSNKSRTRKRPGSALNADFQAPNISTERLTLKRKTGPGLFAKGKSSVPTVRQGLPDLTFSEMAFLKKKRRPSRTPLDDVINKRVRKMGLGTSIHESPRPPSRPIDLLNIPSSPHHHRQPQGWITSASKSTLSRGSPYIRGPNFLRPEREAPGIRHFHPRPTCITPTLYRSSANSHPSWLNSPLRNATRSSALRRPSHTRPNAPGSVSSLFVRENQWDPLPAIRPLSSTNGHFLGSLTTDALMSGVKSFAHGEEQFYSLDDLKMLAQRRAPDREEELYTSDDRHEAQYPTFRQVPHGPMRQNHKLEAGAALRFRSEVEQNQTRSPPYMGVDIMTSAGFGHLTRPTVHREHPFANDAGVVTPPSLREAMHTSREGLDLYPPMAALRERPEDRYERHLFPSVSPRLPSSPGEFHGGGAELYWLRSKDNIAVMSDNTLDHADRFPQPPQRHAVDRVWPETPHGEATEIYGIPPTLKEIRPYNLPGAFQSLRRTNNGDCSRYWAGSPATTTNLQGEQDWPRLVRPSLDKPEEKPFTGLSRPHLLY